MGRGPNRNQTLSIEVYKDFEGEWRSRIVSPNGRILFVSSESYQRAGDVEKALGSLVDRIKTDKFRIQRLAPIRQTKEKA